jgi:hypothetical protein
MCLRPLAAALLATVCVARPVSAQDRGLVTLRSEELERARAMVRSDAVALRPALDRLRAEADSALHAGPFSVMDKRRIPPSGDKHDYISMGPYWWPDPGKPNGLPYIRRDGQRNPEREQDYDSPRLSRMLGAVNTLALAYAFTNDERYARHAANLLRTWFLDPATRMNPNLEYAQEIPGITQGRGIGIIDTNGLPLLLDDIVLLRRSASWTARDGEGMRVWLAAFLRWLRTSKHGHDESEAQNNHGSWYDAQVAALALFAGDSALARDVVEASKTRRIARQISADGSQPLELERTRSLSYSVFNLKALMQLAEIGRHVGIDLWHYEAPEGGSIRKALDYLAPYADPTRNWSGTQITPVEPYTLLPALRMGEMVYGDTQYRTLIEKIPPELVRADRVQLLYPPRDSRSSRGIRQTSTAFNRRGRRGIPRTQNHDRPTLRPLCPSATSAIEGLSEARRAATSPQRERVVGRERCPAPDFARRPLLRRIPPERGVGRQAERQKDGRAQVEASRGDVAFAQVRLRAEQSDAQPAIRIESAGRIHDAPYHRGERAPHLGGRQIVRQLVLQRDLREQLKGAEPVRDRTADRGVAAIGRDEPLENGAVAARDLALSLLHRGVAIGVRPERGEDVEQERLDHEAVVVVPVEIGAVAVDAITEVELLELAQDQIDARLVPFLAHAQQRHLDHRTEQQPVRVGRGDVAGGYERGDQVAPDRGIDGVPQCARRADDGVCEERRIHERLPLLGEVHEVWRARIDRVGERGVRQLDVAPAALALGRIIRTELEPRGDAGQRAAERFEMGDRSPTLSCRRALLDRHARAQLAPRQVRQHGRRDAVERVDPVRAVVGLPGQ